MAIGDIKIIREKEMDRLYGKLRDSEIMYDVELEDKSGIICNQVEAEIISRLARIEQMLKVKK